MPASVTHAYFSNDVYDILPNTIKKNLSTSRMRMFGQSTDSFIFYHLFSLKSGKKLREFQGVFHTTKTREFFVSLISYIKKYHLEKDVDTCSFLCGFICHYVLDSIVHPYVYYKTGYFNKKDSKTYQYNNLHLLMEVFLDNYLILDREKENPYQFPITDFCFDMKSFSPGLNKVIRSTFQDVFSISDMDKKYYQSLKDMKFSLRVFRQDRFGVKRFVYRLVDSITPRSFFKFEAVSYHCPLKTKYQFLNFHHHIWRNPTTYSITSRESFYDLYARALKTAKSTIEKTISYLDGDDVDLSCVFTNLSYLTGLDCDLDKELKYFEF